ncbi:MAG: hypothetical protein IPK81_00680 [Rhodospirillales bacterium]|nr:hypothetical protein [Rhodospirillales bacterium]QQS12839.1 MAG: hypothetical protein IPK81_00680 [Rhodospirillales bacterium]
MSPLRRLIRYLANAVAAVIVGVVVLGMLALWRLSSGPIDLDFLRGYATRSFDTPEGQMTLAADRVSLAWGGARDPLRLILADIAATDARGRRVATVPEVTISLNPRTVASGRFAPTEITVDHVKLDVVITRDGLIEMIVPKEGEGASGGIIPVLVEQLLAEPGGDHVLGSLAEVRIGSARVKVDDRTTGFVWEAPAARATMSRDAAGVRVRGALTVEAGGHRAEFQLDALYGRTREQLDITLRADGVRLAAFATAAPQLAPLAGLDLPMDGAITLTTSGKGEIRHVAIDLHGGAGKVGIPGVLEPARAVDRVDLRMSFAPATNVIALREFSVDFGGPVARMSGALELKGRAFRFEGKAAVTDVPLSRLGEFWLEPLARNAREWAVANVSGGTLRSATLDLALRGDLDHVADLTVERSVADLVYDGLTVRYLDPLPPARGVGGTARFDGVNMRFDIAAATAGALKLAGGTVDLIGLDKADGHTAAIEVRIEAAAADALAYLAQPRLGLSKEFLFDPAKASGDVALTLKLSFPLLADLTMAQLDYAATADLTRVGLRDAVLGLALQDTTAKLEVDPRELKVVGRTKVEGQTFDVTWRELFGPKPAFRRRYEVRGVAPMPLLAKAGVTFLNPYISGPVGLQPLVYQVPLVGSGELSVKADLKAAKVTMPELRFDKAAGVDGTASVVARFGPGGPAPPTTDFDVRAPQTAIVGRLVVRPSDGRFETATFSRFELGRTNLAGTMRRTEDGYGFDFRGAAFDITRFLDGDKDPKARPGPEVAAPPPTGPVLRFSIDAAQVLFKRGALPAVKGTLVQRGDLTLSADLTTTPSAAGPARVVVAAAGPGRQIAITAPDTGAVLRSVGWLDGLVGGALSVEARTDDTKADPPMSATVALTNFRLAKTQPVAGRETPSLNGVVDQLDKAGDSKQVFKSLGVAIDKRGPQLRLRTGRTTGDSISLTFQGGYDLDKDDICLAGAVGVSSFLDIIFKPLDILTGGRSQGVALNYKIYGPIADPKGDVNMLSAVPIGILRRVMESDCLPGDRTPARSIIDLEQRQRERLER